MTITDEDDRRLAYLIEKCGGDRALVGQEGYIGGGPSSRLLVIALRELQQRREIMREAREYMRHKLECSYYVHERQPNLDAELREKFGQTLSPCTCGLDALLTRMEGLT